MNPMRMQLIPSYARNVPEVVTEANTVAEEATVAVERAAAAMGKAETESKLAAGHDTAAATAAVREGKQVPAATEPSKQEALERAQRTFTALESEATEAMRARDRLIASALQDDEWIDAQHEVVDAAVAEVDALAEQLAATFEGLREQAAILDSLYGRRVLARRDRPLIPPTPTAGRWQRQRGIGQRHTVQRADGSFEHIGAPIRPEPKALVAALSSVAREIAPERDSPEPTPEEIQKREDFERTRKAWADMSKGGVFVPSGPVE